MDLRRDSVEGHDVGRRATVSIFFYCQISTPFAPGAVPMDGDG